MPRASEEGNGRHRFRAGTVQREFAELRAAYLEKMVRRLEELSDLLARARRAAAPEEELQQAAALVHQLHGSAGSYGFGAVSSAAASLERTLELLLERPGGARPLESPQQDPLWAQIAESLQRAQVAGQQAVAEGQLTAAQLARVERDRLAFDLLVVDGDLAFLHHVHQLGQRHLINVTTTPSPQHAQGHLRAARVDAVFVGERLVNGEAGLPLVARLRKLAAPRDLPVAYVGEQGRLEPRVAAVRYGVSLYLSKPLDEPTFVLAMRRLGRTEEVDDRHVLIVHQDAEQASWLTGILEQEQLAPHVLLEPQRLLETLEEVHPDLVLIELELPEVSGGDLCRVIRSSTRWQMLPVIALSSRGVRERRLEAFTAGADDFLARPLDRGELLQRVHLRLERARLLERQAERDNLTGLLSYRSFVDAFAARLAEVERQGQPLAFCLLDLDDFRQINRRFGRRVGDRVLAGLGRMLATRLRASDLRGRWSGQGFALVLPGLGLGLAARVVARTQGKLREMSFLALDGEPFHTTLSAGISGFPTDGSTLDELVRAAYRRLHLAKQQGRDSIQTAGALRPPP